MGDRATIQVVTKFDYSPIIYLHWAGSRAVEIIQKAAPIMRKSDLNYAFARLAGCCHLATGPDQGLSFGIWNADEIYEEDVTGDNGHFQVNLDTGEIRNNGELVGTFECGY